MLLAMPKKALSPLENVLRNNVVRLLNEHYQGKAGRLVVEHKRVRLETLQNIVNGSGSASIAMLGPLAEAFDLKPYQLLIPDLDVNAPQEAITAKQMRAIRELRGEK